MIFRSIEHVHSRRRALKARFDVARQFEEIEETCIPAYLHWNLAAAGAAWSRLFVAVNLYGQHAFPGPVLDFGSGSGELSHLLPPEIVYEFVEMNEEIANATLAMQPKAIRRRLDELSPAHYAAVFALNSLEHNENVANIFDSLIVSLRPNAPLILSGPTENFLYRAGRSIAGFSVHYHKATIYDIESVASTRLTLLQHRVVPFGVPLYSITAWKAS
jgi:2-polyprenyl-3-methyl-5-hydroxy-6-metoxy-1,4-benzoquinol methylase